MKIFLTNLGKYTEGYLIGKWVKLPVSEEVLDKVLEEIGINEYYEEYFITDYENDIVGLGDVISKSSSSSKIFNTSDTLLHASYSKIAPSLSVSASDNASRRCARAFNATTLEYSEIIHIIRYIYSSLWVAFL